MSKHELNDAGRTIPYGLGHSDREIERLSKQARAIDPITREFFRAAGLVSGMRVLDVGSGAGDVAFLAAELVGEAGEVIGVDRAPAAVAAARARADARTLRQASFREGDPTGMAFERPFDAVVGRYVLMFQPNPAAALRALARHLRPGGVVVFHEPDWTCVQSFPRAPTYDRCCQWIVETFRLLGTDMEMGLKLHAAFVAAGLPAPSMRLEAIIAGGADSPERLDVVPDIVGSLLPAMERLGVATAAEVGIETLAGRVRDEVVASGGVVVGRSEIAAWARV